MPSLAELTDPYSVWCREHGVTHGHCPHECCHPQPIGLDDGRLVCGRCLVIDGVPVEMPPCDPTTCPD